MAVNYDPKLRKDKDWVRFNIGDTAYDAVTQSIDAEQAVLQDEEIEALLVEEPNKWLAAARAAMIILAQDQGAIVKQVDDLRLENSEDPKSAYLTHIRYLQSEGARLRLDGNPVFKVL